MIINNVDISTFQARQQRVSFDHASIKNNSEWAAHSAAPYFEKNSIGMKSFTVELVVKGQNREDIIGNTSSILAMLLDACDLTLDGFTHKFRAILKKHSTAETSMRRWHILKLDFEGYEYGESVTASGASSFQISNPGNIVSPCRVEITPRVGVASASFTGICRDSYTGEDKPVIIENLETNKKVIIDGVTGLITQGGQPKEMELWALPSLVPGSTTITCSSGWIDISVIVTPLYM